MCVCFFVGMSFVVSIADKPGLILSPPVAGDAPPVAGVLLRLYGVESSSALERSDSIALATDAQLASILVRTAIDDSVPSDNDCAAISSALSSSLPLRADLESGLVIYFV